MASDEIQAHTGMFDGKTNDGYYELGLITSQLLRDVIVSIRTRASGDEALKPTLTPVTTMSSLASEEKVTASKLTSQSPPLSGKVETSA